MVRQRQDAGEAGHRRGARGQDQVRAAAMGERPTSTGWKTSSRGASRARSGGAIKFRRGMGRMAKIFVAETEDEAVAEALAHYSEIEEITVEEGHDIAADPERRARFAQRIHQARRGRARHLVLLGAVAVLDAGLAGRDAGAQALLSDLGAGHRLRHHLLLGRAHDDDGPAFHERGAVPRRLHPPPGARRHRRQDVEVEGQRRRSAWRHRRIRRRRAALHAAAHGAAQGHDIRLGRRTSRTTAISRPSCGTPRASPKSTAARASRVSIRHRAKETLNRWIAHETAKAAARNHRGDRSLQASTMRPARSIVSSGTSIATGMSNCRSRCSPAPMAPRRARRAPWPPGRSTKS